MDGISIVIISRGREKLLEELLLSVKKAQQQADFPTEIILVDSSLAESKAKVRSLSEKYNTKYFYQDITVSAKRNYGAKQSRYDVVLFLDSDCVVTQNILKEYAQIYRKHPDAGGAAGPLEFVGEDTWFWKVVEKTPYTIFFSTAKWADTLTWSPTANFSVKKEAFLSVGGFDETFPKNPGGEDVDVGLRLTKAGYVLYSAKQALVYHSKATWSPVKAMFRRVFHYGAGDFYLIERYPHMSCRCMPRRIIMILLGMLMYVLLGFAVNPWFFLGVPAVALCEMSLMSLCVNHLMKYKKTTFAKQFVVQALLLWNEAGYLCECIRKRKIRNMRKQLIFFKPQMDGICYQNVVTSVLYCLFLLVTFILVMLGV
ncbi:MAG: glycosyltransferase [Acutalibacteraceae bacterium]